jgi:hypothetical protein
MAAPTLSDFQQSSWNGRSSVNEATTSATWSAGDVLVAVGATEDNATVSMGTPTATGLTFSSVQTTNTNNNTKCYIWTATAGSGGSGAVTSVNGGTSNALRGLAVFVYSGSDGIGNSALMASTSTTNATVSLTRAGNNSAVIVVMGDWTPVNDTTVTTNPSTGGTVRIIQFTTGAANLYVGSWADEGAAGTTGYGIGSYTATPTWIGAVVEIKGSAGGGAAFIPAANKPIQQAVKRASYH